MGHDEQSKLLPSLARAKVAVSKMKRTGLEEMSHACFRQPASQFVPAILAQDRLTRRRAQSRSQR